MNQEISNYFKQNNYVVIRDFLSQDMSSLLSAYTLLKVQNSDVKYMKNRQKYDEVWDGGWSLDTQIPNTFHLYGDPMMDSLMSLSKSKIEEFTDLSLYNNYTYWRLYKTHDELKRHVDRKSCEISATVCLGYDVSNVDKTVYPDYNWAMFIKDMSGKEIPVTLNPGDMIIYRGEIIEHWREPFKGICQAQVFMHYNDVNGSNKIEFDGRNSLGIPKGL